MQNLKSTMANCSAYKDFIATVGISLIEELCINDIALTPEDCVTAIGLLRNGRVAILGGEGYFRVNSSISYFDPPYASWSVETRPGESFEDYCARSYEDSLRFIRNFLKNQKEEVLFSLTPLCPPLTLETLARKRKELGY